MRKHRKNGYHCGRRPENWTHVSKRYGFAAGAMACWKRRTRWIINLLGRSWNRNFVSVPSGQNYPWISLDHGRENYGGYSTIQNRLLRLPLSRSGCILQWRLWSTVWSAANFRFSGCQHNYWMRTLSGWNFHDGRRSKTGRSTGISPQSANPVWLPEYRWMASY